MTAGAARNQPGRLLFALDATASRQAAWDQACQLQGEMFIEAAAVGELQIQVLFYRGFAEFKSSPWATDADTLLRHMNQVSCLGGTTQIARVLNHAIASSSDQRISALVFVGDCMEENPQELYDMAGQLGILGLPVFIFHEGREPVAARSFRRIAELSHGAYCPFDAGSARQLRELLRAVAAFAAGGRRALEDFGRRHDSDLVKRLTHQIGRR